MYKRSEKKTADKKKQGQRAVQNTPPVKEILITATCTGLDESGKGSISYQSQTLAVSNLLPQEQANIRIQSNGQRTQAEVVSYIQSAPSRVKVACQVFDTCGGCQLLHMAYPAQLLFKQALVRNAFKTVQLSDTVFLPIIDDENPLHYRHKNQAVFGMSKRKHIISGFYQEDSHKIVNYDACLIQHDTANAIITTFKQLMGKYKLLPYDSLTRTGIVRHVFIRCGYASDELMLIIVTAGELLPGRKGIVQDLRKAHPNITTIVQSINSKQTSMVLGDKQFILHGEGTINDALCGVQFQLSPNSFYQVNPRQTEKLYGCAIELAKLTSEDVVLDAYCGIGTISLFAALHCKEIVGVELSQNAVKDAIRNASRNKIKNAYFIQEDASSYMEKLAAQHHKLDVLFMDPPRSGADIRFMNAVQALLPQRIVYVSCNVETQARDVRQMVRMGYMVEAIQPVDMFPQTKHVECVCLLTRSK